VCVCVCVCVCVSSCVCVWWWLVVFCVRELADVCASAGLAGLAGPTASLRRRRSARHGGRSGGGKVSVARLLATWARAPRMNRRAEIRSQVMASVRRVEVNQAAAGAGGAEARLAADVPEAMWQIAVLERDREGCSQGFTEEGRCVAVRAHDPCLPHGCSGFLLCGLRATEEACPQAAGGKGRDAN
jgi:hypothetical protein